MNFLSDYMLFNQGNEANQHYHQWCAFSALAACVSRKVWVDMGYFNIYPNLYITLVGPPGGKKNTALNVAKDLVRTVGDIPLSGDCQSKEQLVKEMAETCVVSREIPGRMPYIYTPLNIYVTELSQFIGIDPLRMIDFLTTAFDVSVYDHRTLRHNVLRLEGPYINLLSATVPDWITTYLKADVIAGGFSRRCVFVLEYEDGPRIAFPEITAEMKSAWARCIEHCQHLKHLYGAFTWEPEVHKWYKNWYETRVISKNPVIAPFDRTKFIYVLKLAMLLSLCKSFDLVLREEHIKTALGMVDRIIVRLPQVFSGMGRNELAQVTLKVENSLRKEGVPVAERDMRARMWNDCNDNEWYQVIRHLVDSGKVKALSDTHQRVWLSLPEWSVEVTKSAQADAPASGATTGQPS